MRCAHKERLKASNVDEDVLEEVVQMQNIVKCFRRSEDDGMRVSMLEPVKAQCVS